MKLGWDSKTGLNRTCKSWRNQNDPSSGYFTFIIQLDGLPQVIIRGGSVIKNRAGQWYNGRFSGSDPLGDTAVYSTKFEYSADEVTYSYEARSSLFIRFELSSIGDVWDEGKKILASGVCIAKRPLWWVWTLGILDFVHLTGNCTCLDGFEPRNHPKLGEIILGQMVALGARVKSAEMEKGLKHSAVWNCQILQGNWWMLIRALKNAR